MTDRLEKLKAFLHGSGWGDADRSLLAADASFRHYDRLKKGKETLVLMNAPPPMEDVRPFVRIARHLEKLGLSAPAIKAVDEQNGFVLLEDFEDDTYTRLLNKGADGEELYALAVDVLIHLHNLHEHDAVPEGLPLYDDEAMMREARLFTDWFMPAVTGSPMSEAAVREYEAAWHKVFPKAKDVPQTLVLRDYHVDNLMRLKKKGLKACGLLDFQDALHGSVSYDIMSLLEDARRDVSDVLFSKMRKRYLGGMGEKIGNIEKFMSSWAVLAAQRHAKILGIFVRLCVRDGKDRYLVHLPRVWKLLTRALEHPDLKELKEWFANLRLDENAFPQT